MKHAVNEVFFRLRNAPFVTLLLAGLLPRMSRGYTALGTGRRPLIGEGERDRLLQR